MQDMSMKKKILEEIMGLMDEKEGDRLASHPKLMAKKAEISATEPVLESEKEVMPSMEVAEESEEEIDPEMMAKLLEMYKGMK